MQPRVAAFSICWKLFLVLFSRLAFAGEPYPVPSSALTDAARQNLIGGFTYELPIGWSLKSAPGSQYKVAFGREEDGNPANISFQVAAVGGNLGEFEADLLKQLPEIYKGMGVSSPRILDLSAFQTAAKLVGLQAVIEAERLDGKTARQLMYFFERKDGQKICVTCSVAGEGTRYDAIFDSIMKTFKVTK
jgi:hypothetical protein